MVSKNKTLKIGFLILIIIISIFLNQKIIQGRDKPETDLPDVNNPLPFYPPDAFHIWNDRLYFQSAYVVYRYDISNRQNITYINHLQVGSGETLVDFYENKMFTVDIKYVQRKDESTLTINTYDITDDIFNFIETKEVKVEMRITELNIVEGYLLILEEFPWTQEYIPRCRIIPLNETGIYTFPVSIEANNIHLKAKATWLEGNLLYFLANSWSTDQGIFHIIDVSELTNLVLLGNCTFSEDYLAFNTLEKVENLVYIESIDGYLHIINVTDKMNPFEEENFILSSYVYEMRVSNHYVAAADSYKTVWLYNLTDLDSITLLDSYNITDEQHTYGLDILPDLIIVSRIDKILLLDWSDPENITYLILIAPPYFEKIGFNPFLIFPGILLLFYFIKKKKKRKN
ncbi:MAG: hypothetical protein ACTSXA_15155 [Candidatus Heimdallarchaeota archaeon]